VTGVFFDLSGRAKFRVRGSDAFRFLNGQITNDLRKATATEAIEACVLSAKGKMNAHLLVHAPAPGVYQLEADATLRSALPERLARYIIADDVQIEDVTEQWALFHILAAARPDLPNEWPVVRARRLLEAGWDAWISAEAKEQTRAFLAGHLAFQDEAAAERLRLAAGLPAWGRELNEEIIPIEANLEERCVDYDKGCYIGQEVISRIKMSGQTNKRLRGLVSSGGESLVAGMRLQTIPEKREVGWVTSSGSLGDKKVALGFVKRGFNEPGTKLIAGNANEVIKVQVTALPFDQLLPKSLLTR
jgi:tRNA-modifying protein YgfZ